MGSKVKLSDAIELIGGGTPKTTIQEYWNGDIPWLSVVDFNNDSRKVFQTEKSITSLGLEKSSTKLLKENDIIISARGTVGAIAQLGKEMAFNQSCYGIRGKKGVDNTFLYYLIKTKIEELKKNSHGSVFSTITRDTFDSIEVTLPSLKEQKRIAAILSAFDDKIALNQEMNKTLEAMAQALFKSWFVDFEPFGGVMPSDWREGTLTDIAEYLNGLAMQKFRPIENEKSLPVLKIKELRQGHCDTSSDVCSENIKPEYIINNGDVIFSWSGSLLVDLWCGGDCGLNQHLFKVTSKDYEKWFYYLWTKHHLNQFIEIAKDKATTMGHIKREHLNTAKVAIPDKNIYNTISKTAQPLLDMVIANRIENSKLVKLRDTLLPKLINGEIKL